MSNVDLNRNYKAEINKLSDELAKAKRELASAGTVKPQFLIDDDDDEYQDQLELSWWKAEQRDLIEDLTRRLDNLRRESEGLQ